MHIVKVEEAVDGKVAAAAVAGKAAAAVVAGKVCCCFMHFEIVQSTTLIEL